MIGDRACIACGDDSVELKPYGFDGPTAWVCTKCATDNDLVCALAPRDPPKIKIVKTKLYDWAGVDSWAFEVEGKIVLDGFRSEREARDSVPCYLANFWRR